MSFLKRLFGMSGGDDGGEAQGKSTGTALDYNGFKILATPYKADGQFQTEELVHQAFALAYRQRTGRPANYLTA